MTHEPRTNREEPRRADLIRMIPLTAAVVAGVIEWHADVEAGSAVGVARDSEPKQTGASPTIAAAITAALRPDQSPSERAAERRFANQKLNPDPVSALAKTPMEATDGE